MIFGMQPRLKHLTTDVIATFVYWPLTRLSLLLEWMKAPVDNVPLSYYRHHSFYTMRTDARDRFGTPLEQRFTRSQIIAMMDAAGLVDLKFSDKSPFWCVVGTRREGIKV